LKRVFESLQLALLIHGFYVVAVTNFGDFNADLTAPWCVEIPGDLTLKLDSYFRSLRVQGLMGSM